MNNLEEQADNAKARELFWKPLSWLGAIRPTSTNDAFDPALWETFVSTTLGLEGKIVNNAQRDGGARRPILSALPQFHNSPLAKCGCKKFCMNEPFSRRPHEHVHSSLRCNQGARLDGVRTGAVVPTRPGTRYGLNMA